MATVEVRINGRAYPCRMTMGAMLRYRRLTGKEVSEMEGGSVSELATLLYCCTASACSADGVEFGMSLDEFCDCIGPEDMERMSAGIRTDNSGDGGSKKAAGIAELLGVAVGAMGMSAADFCSMTPEEFRQAHGAWMELEESKMRSGWEMARTLSAEFNEASANETRLAQSMKTAMGATQEQVDAIISLTAAQEELGVVDGQFQISAAQQLAKFLQTTDALQTLIPLMNDMAAQQYGVAASEQNLMSIATQLGKVLNGQTEALQRSGYRMSIIHKFRDFRTRKKQLHFCNCLILCGS